MASPRSSPFLGRSPARENLTEPLSNTVNSIPPRVTSITSTAPAPAKAAVPRQRSVTAEGGQPAASATSHASRNTSPETAAARTSVDCSLTPSGNTSIAAASASNGNSCCMASRAISGTSDGSVVGTTKRLTTAWSLPSDTMALPRASPARSNWSPSHVPRSAGVCWSGGHGNSASRRRRSEPPRDASKQRAAVGPRSNAMSAAFATCDSLPPLPEGRSWYRDCGGPPSPDSASWHGSRCLRGGIVDNFTV